MAINSLRERIILADIELVKNVSAIKTVKRIMPSFEDLDNAAVTELPLAAVFGNLPTPDNHVSRRTGQVDEVISSLSVSINVYMQENVNADSKISEMLDDFWVQLYSDPTRGSLCLFTSLTVNSNIEVWPPFVAFQLICNHKYKHGIGGI